jgi:hypothetical protein
VLDTQTLDRIWRTAIREQLFRDNHPSRTPTLVVIGAQPGAGKTRAAIAAKAFHPGETFVDIIGDDMRLFHPDYDRLQDDPDPNVMPAATAGESAWWVERALRYASENGISVLVESTFRNPDTTLSTARMFDGFTCHAVALGVPQTVSWQSCVARYLAAMLTGRPKRRTSLEHHNLAYHQMIPTLAEVESAGIFHRLTAIDRNGAIQCDGERGWIPAVEHLRTWPSSAVMEEFQRTQQWLAEIPRQELPAQVVKGLQELDLMELPTPQSPG